VNLLRLIFSVQELLIVFYGSAFLVSLTKFRIAGNPLVVVVGFILGIVIFFYSLEALNNIYPSDIFGMIEGMGFPTCSGCE